MFEIQVWLDFSEKVQLSLQHWLDWQTSSLHLYSGSHLHTLLGETRSHTVQGGAESQCGSTHNVNFSKSNQEWKITCCHSKVVNLEVHAVVLKWFQYLCYIFHHMFVYIQFYVVHLIWLCCRRFIRLCALTGHFTSLWKRRKSRRKKKKTLNNTCNMDD